MVLSLRLVASWEVVQTPKQKAGRSQRNLIIEGGLQYDPETLARLSIDSSRAISYAQAQDENGEDCGRVLESWSRMRLTRFLVIIYLW
jgi:hypothetical protein